MHFLILFFLTVFASPLWADESAPIENESVSIPDSTPIPESSPVPESSPTPESLPTPYNSEADDPQGINPDNGGDPDRQTGWTRSTTLEQMFDELQMKTKSIGKDLTDIKVKMQYLHTSDEISNVLQRHPEWKVLVNQYTIDQQGKETRQWELEGKEIYQSLMKRGIDPSRMEWGGVGPAPIPLKLE